VLKTLELITPQAGAVVFMQVVGISNWHEAAVPGDWLFPKVAQDPVEVSWDRNNLSEGHVAETVKLAVF